MKKVLWGLSLVTLMLLSLIVYTFWLNEGFTREIDNQCNAVIYDQFSKSTQVVKLSFEGSIVREKLDSNRVYNGVIKIDDKAYNCNAEDSYLMLQPVGNEQYISQSASFDSESFYIVVKENLKKGFINFYEITDDFFTYSPTSLFVVFPYNGESVEELDRIVKANSKLIKDQH